jgi:hypothetical protein
VGQNPYYLSENFSGLVLAESADVHARSVSRVALESALHWVQSHFSAFGESAAAEDRVGIFVGVAVVMLPGKGQDAAPRVIQDGG